MQNTSSGSQLVQTNITPVALQAVNFSTPSSYTNLDLRLRKNQKNKTKHKGRAVKNLCLQWSEGYVNLPACNTNKNIIFYIIIAESNIVKAGSKKNMFCSK